MTYPNLLSCQCISININRTEPPTFSFAVTAYVDGDTIRSHAVKRPAESYLVNFNAVTTSDVTERGLMFAPMTLTGMSFISIELFQI